MTSNWALAVMFLAPVVLALGVGVAIAIDEGKLAPMAVMAAIAVATSALLLGLARLGMKYTYRELGQRFAALASALGGTVVENLLGERQLRLAHPRGRLEVDYRVYGSDGGTHDRYTRVALVLPAGSLPADRRDMLQLPADALRLGPATRAEVEALPGRVRLLGRGASPSVEVWAHGWLDEQEAVRLLKTSRPRLEALAIRPWSE